MKKLAFIILFLATGITSCGKPVVPPPTSAPPPTQTPVPPTATEALPLPTVTPVCISAEPTQQDIDRALSYTGGIFDSPGWEQSHAASATGVSVTWQNIAAGAVVYLEAIIFPCGYEEPDLNNYYSDENWTAIFQNYESYELVERCKSNDGLRLYEFKTQNQGFEYGIKYWVENDTDTRVISTMFVFPLESKLLLDEYSSMLFPNYSTCP